MKKVFEQYGLFLEEKKLKELQFFLKIFMDKNSQINLSAIREKNDIIIKHFIDSLILTKFIELK
jgi:16S rRNA (guanine527-N7)-methyltransferase